MTFKLSKCNRENYPWNLNSKIFFDPHHFKKFHVSKLKNQEWNGNALRSSLHHILVHESINVMLQLKLLSRKTT
ncbi:hypothetical protein EUGRSUZ_E00836 [Eucalyptus grandis]|uniref:Uncharacterized protein n=2 Tax=Eucalyptus grandis TaxID=71139 RepID=A0ACC3KSZ9_EUCGR|nr:hypothetical protein EUGRSUZ_E00836 [Eucalyptus grandis]